PGEYHADWVERLQEGACPSFGFNRFGFYVRSRQGTASPTDAKVINMDGTEHPPTTEKPMPKQRFTLRSFVAFDPAMLQPRQWLYGRHYQRRTVSATIAPGGFGKTTLGMVEAVSMATCRNLLGEQPEARLRVWYHNGEDNLEELNRRLAAICMHNKIPQKEL